MLGWYVVSASYGKYPITRKFDWTSTWTKISGILKAYISLFDFESITKSQKILDSIPYSVPSKFFYVIFQIKKKGKCSVNGLGPRPKTCGLVQQHFNHQ